MSPSSVSFAIALGVHLLILGALLALAPKPYRPVAAVTPEVPPSPEPVIELIEVPPAQPEVPGREEVASVGPARELSPSTHAPAPSTRPTEGEARASEPTTETPAPVGSGVTFGGPSLGLNASGAGNPFLRPGAVEAPHDDGRPTREWTIEDGKRRVEQSLRDAVAERDTAIGLGPEGPAVNALSEATRESATPVKSKAVFVITANAEGVVLDVRLGSSGSDARWAPVRALAAEKLRDKRLAMRGAKGVELRIEVSSDVTLPSGSAPGTIVSKGDLSPVPVQTPAIANPRGGTEGDVWMTYEVGKFDIADLGATPQRTVHTRVLGVRRF
ncbi:hypothetical protein AKJ09_07573 [Labilithrix luteola]|uniref:Uncharacterized protein n=1 Tax=Labilithrix luteola TaxID=1391654 RepID=A0A0K1Q669_9BACT|nr:hypothetical protein [Labilithrix luteola]AKV00910.1 hypothetical protein AKJ09_07573 [Labilithrix luteola]